MDRSASVLVMQDVNARRVAVRSIAWLGVRGAIIAFVCPVVKSGGDDKQEPEKNKPDAMTGYRRKAKARDESGESPKSRSDRMRNITDGRHRSTVATLFPAPVGA